MFLLLYMLLHYMNITSFNCYRLSQSIYKKMFTRKYTTYCQLVGAVSSLCMTMSCSRTASACTSDTLMEVLRSFFRAASTSSSSISYPIFLLRDKLVDIDNFLTRLFVASCTICNHVSYCHVMCAFWPHLGKLCIPQCDAAQNS